ncbi:carcinoembryonic antigen-related cell adhesion molecule 1 [Aplochiton taeniatus]
MCLMKYNLKPISNVTLRANNTNLVELNGTAVLTCSVSSGTSLAYRWLNGSSEVTLTANTGVQIGNGSSTLTIASVTRYDQGPFRCNVSNGISYGTSQPLALNISYGPSDPTLTVAPMKSAHKTGSNITLSCATESNPPATFQWVFEGRYLNQYSRNLSLDNAKVNQTGSYKCLVTNPVTLRFTSGIIMLRIVGKTALTFKLTPISAVDVRYAGRPPILFASVTLSCDVTGPVDFIRWWKNGQELTADNRTAVSMDNKTVTVNPIQLTDSGDNYQCQAFNSVSNMTSPSNYLVVNYGPEKPVITGKSMAMTGHSVTFNCSASSQPPSFYNWFFNGSQVATGSEFTTGPLNLSSSGMYTCMASNSITEQNSTTYTMLTVWAPVTMTTVKVVGPQPIENQTFTLSCMSAGSVDSILWMMNNKPLYADNRKVFSMKNATLTFNPVLQYDMGNYQCAASNPFSNMTSDYYNLIVNYGPERPAITGPTLAMSGASVTFNCSASSQPPSFYNWFFNGSQVATGSEFMTGLLNLNSSGMYTCVAYNNVTDKNSTAYAMLSVIDPISAVQIAMPLKPAIEDHPYTLSCEVTGPVVYIQWWKNGQALMADNRTVFSMDNTTVILNPVRRSNNGDYQCQAGNAVSNMISSPHRVWVNYGPENTVIIGPTAGETGRRVTFRCLASSQPPSSYQWFFNGSQLANGSEYMTGHLTFNSSGKYSCVAYNNVTKQNSTAYTMLTVIEAIESVMVKASTIPIAYKMLTLTCEITGPYDSISWLKDNTTVNVSSSYPASNMSLYTVNNSLHFNPVTKSNNGNYQCATTNQYGLHRSAKYTLLANYGPLGVDIIGPNTVVLGSVVTVTLRCNADSQPTSKYKWLFNHQSEVGTGAILGVQRAGEYVCLATNPVTNITMSKTVGLGVTGK